MSLPIHERREFIQRHNAEQEKENAAAKQNSNEVSVGGAGINAYAAMEQSNRGIGKRS